MVRAILYGTLGCHLCDDAEALLAPLLASVSAAIGNDCEIECIDIADDDDLLDRYGERIPVLRRVADGVELGWPFDAAAAGALLMGSDAILNTEQMVAAAMAFWMSGELVASEKLLLKAAQAGSGLAAHNLGTLYAVGGADIQQDAEKSRRWFELAIASGFEANVATDPVWFREKSSKTPSD